MDPRVLHRLYSGYPYHFNGMEKDDEWTGNSGDSYDFGARMYDSRLGRWRAIDSDAHRYPANSLYNYVLNNPIIMIDPDGNNVYYVVQIPSGYTETGEVILAPLVLDVVKDRAVLEKVDPEFVAGYDLAKSTESGGELLGEYETSTTNDVYMAVGVLGPGTLGITEYQAETDGDGKVAEDPYIGYDQNGKGLAPNHNAAFNGVQTELGKTSSLVVLSPENGALGYGSTILHEVKFHVDLAKDGVPLLDQHKIAYGNADGNPETAAPDCPNQLLYEEVRDKYLEQVNAVPSQSEENNPQQNEQPQNNDTPEKPK